MVAAALAELSGGYCGPRHTPLCAGVGNQEQKAKGGPCLRQLCTPTTRESAILQRNLAVCRVRPFDKQPSATPIPICLIFFPFVVSLQHLAGALRRGQASPCRPSSFGKQLGGMLAGGQRFFLCRNNHLLSALELVYEDAHV